MVLMATLTFFPRASSYLGAFDPLAYPSAQEYLGGRLEKTKTLIGENGNRAEIKEEERNPKTEIAQHGRDLLKRAGKLYSPLGYNYIGSAAVHYYEKPGILPTEKDYATSCQTSVGACEEFFADLGWKNLKTALMKAYGREEPKKRK